MPEMKHDGGPAFPMPASETSIGGHYEQLGMSLRDWFAGQALAGWIASYGPEDGRPNPGACASIAYQVADAMIAARSESLPLSKGQEEGNG